MERDLPVFSHEDEIESIIADRVWAWLINKGDGYNWVRENPASAAFWVYLNSEFMGTLRRREDGWLVHPFNEGEVSLHDQLSEAYQAVLELR